MPGIARKSCRAVAGSQDLLCTQAKNPPFGGFFTAVQSGNLVNTTSLFYLVPLVTLILDFIIFRTQLFAFDFVWIVVILSGFYLVYKKVS